MSKRWIGMVVLIGAFGACGGSEPQMATGDGVSPPPGAASLSITAQKETLEAVGVARWDIYLPPWSQDWSRLEAIAIGVNAFGARIEKLRIVANRDAAGNGWIDAEAFSGGQWGEKLVINQPTGMAHAESPLGERTRALWVHLSKDSEAHAATVDDLGTMSLGTAYGECGCGGKAAKFWIGLGVLTVGSIAGVVGCAATAGIACPLIATGLWVGGSVVVGIDGQEWQDCESQSKAYHACDTSKPGVVKDKTTCACRCADGFEGSPGGCKQKCPSCACNIVGGQGTLQCGDFREIAQMPPPPDACKSLGADWVQRMWEGRAYCCPPFVPVKDNLCPDQKY